MLIKKILTGYLIGSSGKSINLTIGNYYIHHESGNFKDDKGLLCTVSNYTWEEYKPTLKASETQVAGDHYVKMGLQPLEACYLLYGYKGLKAAIFVKVMKYINRNKDDEVEQLKKARHCLDLLIEKAELENANNS